MKIAYLFNSRMPTEKAHGFQIMQMCDAFAKNGHDVTLIVPKRKNPIKESAWEYYGMETSFRIMEVPVIDFIRWDRWLGRAALWLVTAMYAIGASAHLRKLAPDLVYSRDTTSAFWVSKRFKHIFEAHTFPSRSGLHALFWRRNDRIVTMTDGLKQEFMRCGMNEEKLLVAPDAVDHEKFRAMESKRESRSKLGLPLDGLLAVYVGRPYWEQGVEVLAEAAELVQDRMKVVLVGVDRDTPPCISVGRVPHAEVARYLNAADIAVMPYRGSSEHVAKYASPMKLFEYLAAGKAIVASDLPSIREILDEDSAELVPPGDARALAERLRSLAERPSRVAELESAALRLASKYTWMARAEAVLQGVPRTVYERLMTKMRKYRYPIGILALALLIRLAYVWFFPQHDPTQNDPQHYLALADGIRGAIPWTDQFRYFQPGYPYLLAAVRSVSEDHVFARSVQALISTGTVALIMMMAKRWISAKAGIYAGLIGALYVPMVLDTGVLLTETTFMFFLALGTYLLLRALECRSCLWAIYAGAALGLAGFVREIGFYFAAFLAAYAGLYQRAWRIAGTVVILVFFMVGVIAAQSRILMTDTSAARPLVGKGYEQTVFNDVTFKKNAYALERLTMYPEGLLRFFLFPYRLIDVSDGSSVKQIVLSRDLGGIMKIWPQILAKASLVAVHWILLAMALYGLWKGRASRDLKLMASLLILLAAGTIIFASVGRPAGFDVYAPLARYRFPVEPLIIVLAAAGIERFMHHKTAS